MKKIIFLLTVFLLFSHNSFAQDSVLDLDFGFESKSPEITKSRSGLFGSLRKHKIRSGVPRTVIDRTPSPRGAPAGGGRRAGARPTQGGGEEGRCSG